MKSQIAVVLLVGTLLMTGCGTSASGSQHSSAMGSSTNQTGTAQTTTAQTQTQSPITREQAELIALEHAGLTADQVARLHTEYEVDESIPRFEVQFHQGRWEYDYEINANTGEILSWDRDA